MWILGLKGLKVLAQHKNILVSDNHTAWLAQLGEVKVQEFIKHESVKKSKLPFLFWIKLTPGPSQLFERWIMLSIG